MKARIKSTGRIIQVMNVMDVNGNSAWEEISTMSTTPIQYSLEELDFIDLPKEMQSKPTIRCSSDPDYWTRLEHQYAGMAMQGLSEKYLKEYRDFCADYGEKDEDFSPGAVMEDFANAMADVCYYFAHALVEKYKEKEEKK